VSGNGRVVGSLFYSAGNPAKNARAYLVPVGYNPRRDAALPVSHTVTTDLKGTFSFAIADSGYFNVQATGADQKTALIRGIGSFGNSTALPADTLRAPGAVKVALPDSIDSATGYVYIPGTTLSADARNALNGYVVIGGVPPGSIPGVSIAANAASAGSVLKPDFVVTSGDTVVVNQTWRYKAKLFVNTTARGAGVYGTFLDFPVYIFLTSGNFNFYEAMVNGEDIRFAKADGTPLVHEIALWDSWNGVAEIWVKVDTVYGNSNQQYILMYWGNSDAVSGSRGAEVFDTANGFQGVWHCAAESESDSARDATANHFTGTPFFFRASSADRWNMGIGRSFDGSGCIVMPQTAASRLNVPLNGCYTLSAWASVDTLDTAVHVVAGMDNRYYLILRSVNGSARWEFVKSDDTSSAAWKSVIDDAPVLLGEWNYLFAVWDGAEQYLYVNGRRVQSPPLTTPNPASLPRGAGRDFSIGGFFTDGAQGSGCFKGIIDDVWFSNAAWSADWIKLCYKNQNWMDSVVVLKAP